MNPPEIKQLVAVMVDRLELDALSFTLLGSFIFIILLLTFGPCLFNLFQGFLQDRIQATSRDQVKTVLLLETLMAKSTLWVLDFLPPRPQTPDPHLSARRSPEH